MADSQHSSLMTGARVARGSVAALALGANALLAFIVLFWSCCKGLDIASNASSPLFWATIAGMGVAVVSFPPISRRARRRGWRWFTAPLVIGAAVVVVFAARAMTSGTTFERAWMALVAISTSVCCVYVIARVLFAPPAST